MGIYGFPDNGNHKKKNHKVKTGMMSHMPKSFIDKPKKGKRTKKLLWY